MQCFTTRQNRKYSWFLKSLFCLLLTVNSSLSFAETIIEQNSEFEYEVEDLCASTSNELLAFTYEAVEEISGLQRPLLLVGTYEGSLRDCWGNTSIPKSLTEWQASLSALLISLSIEEDAPIPKHICEIATHEHLGVQYYIVRLPTKNFFISQEACINIIEHSRQANLGDDELRKH